MEGARVIAMRSWENMPWIRLLLAARRRLKAGLLHHKLDLGMFRTIWNTVEYVADRQLLG